MGAGRVGGGVTHAVNLSWVFELPLGRGRKWMIDASPFVEALLGRCVHDERGRPRSVGKVPSRSGASLSPARPKKLEERRRVHL
jgi:hypothetical protein